MIAASGHWIMQTNLVINDKLSQTQVFTNHGSANPDQATPASQRS